MNSQNRSKKDLSSDRYPNKLVFQLQSDERVINLENLEREIKIQQKKQRPAILNRWGDPNRVCDKVQGNFALQTQ